MGILEGLVLLACGLFSGVLATVFDVFAVGGPSFLSHFALWVVLNAFVAIHVESRLRAILWAIPFNLGYIEGYFITTAATFEYYTKSTMVPLAAVALISPLLVYALWTARKEKNVYGRILSVFIAVGTVIASYLINGELGVYDIVMSVILLLLLTVIPVRQLKVTRSERVPDPQPVADGVDAATASEAINPYEGNESVSSDRIPVFKPKKRDDAGERPSRGEKRKRARLRREELNRQREEQRQRERERERRIRRSAEERRKRNDDDAGSPNIPNTNGLSTLGTVRPARRSTRSS